MTTPSAFGTPLQIIGDAMVEAGLIGRGRDPNSDHYAKYINKLNYIFNHLQTKPGLKLWLNYELPITPVQGVNLYTLGPSGSVPMTKPIRGFDGYFTDQNGNRRPIFILGRSEWDTLSNLKTQGSLNNFFVDKQQLTLNVYLWMTPDAQTALGTFYLVVTQQVTQLVSLTDTMNFPIEWYMTIMWQLAAEICTGQPDSVVMRCEAKAAKYLQEIEDWDVEDASTRFQPDQRAMVQTGKFR